MERTSLSAKFWFILVFLIVLDNKSQMNTIYKTLGKHTILVSRMYWLPAFFLFFLLIDDKKLFMDSPNRQ